MGSDALFWPPKAPGTHAVCRHIQAKYLHTLKKKKDKTVFILSLPLRPILRGLGFIVYPRLELIM